MGKRVPTEQKHGHSPFWKITVCEERSKQDEGAKAAEVNVLSTRKPAYIQNLYIIITTTVPIKFALSGAVLVGDGRKFAFLFRKILIDVNTDKEMVVLIDQKNIAVQDNADRRLERASEKAGCDISQSFTSPR